jgi:TM2 domain-containing membrane protein YozV
MRCISCAAEVSDEARFCIRCGRPLGMLEAQTGPTSSIKGTVLDFSTQKNFGMIATDDGKRYKMYGAEWKSTAMPAPGHIVNFEPFQDEARNVYLLFRPDSKPSSSVVVVRKSRGVYMILGVLFGTLGLHNFYAGYYVLGATKLAITFISVLLSVIVIGIIPFIGVWIWALIEAFTVTKDASGELMA